MRELIVFCLPSSTELGFSERQPMITASRRTDLNADHRALSKPTATLLTDGMYGSMLVIFLGTLIKMKNIQTCQEVNLT